MISATALLLQGYLCFDFAYGVGHTTSSQAGIEVGFHAGDAQLIAAQTARGAAALLLVIRRPARTVN